MRVVLGGGVTLPAFWLVFFSSKRPKKTTIPGMNSTRGLLLLTPRCWKIDDMSGFPPHQSKIATFEDESINSIRVFDALFAASFLGNFRWMQKNLHVQSFLVNKHVISWFFKIPVPFSKAFFTSQRKDVSRSPWASEAEKKLQYRLGADCYSKSTGGS